MHKTLEGAGSSAIAADPIFKSICDHIYDEVQDQWELYPTTQSALISLQAWCIRHNCCLGVMTNMDERLPQILSALGICSSFDFILSSYECGVEQPMPEMFHKALELAAVPKSALGSASPVALHCGNSAMEDLHGALGAGFAALLVDKRFASLSPVRPMITEWQNDSLRETRAWHTPHLGLAMSLLEN